MALPGASKLRFFREPPFIEACTAADLEPALPIAVLSGTALH